MFALHLGSWITPLALLVAHGAIGHLLLYRWAALKARVIALSRECSSTLAAMDDEQAKRHRLTISHPLLIRFENVERQCDRECRCSHWLEILLLSIAASGLAMSVQWLVSSMVDPGPGSRLTCVVTGLGVIVSIVVLRSLLVRFTDRQRATTAGAALPRGDR